MITSKQILAAVLSGRMNIKSVVYQGLVESDHRFRQEAIYSLRAIAKILGVSRNAVRLRAFSDGWPFQVVEDRGNPRKPRFIDGAFLAALQAELRKAQSA
ncbi:hypothetical protein OAG77_00315 [bacterium]|jgi:hypothetical protein|nr:hypothetical protein [bacterium]